MQIWEHWTAGTLLKKMMDPSMNNNFSESDVMRCIHVGLLCVQENPADRPVMSAVGTMLGSDMVSLEGPIKKPVSENGFVLSTMSTNDGAKDQSIN